MAVDKNFLAKIAPEYEEIEDDDRLNTLIELAEQNVNSKIWKDKEDHGVAFLVAHMLKMGERKGATGDVTSERVGDLQKSYSSIRDEHYLAQTSYGTEFLRLRKTLLTSPLIV